MEVIFPGNNNGMTPQMIAPPDLGGGGGCQAYFDVCQSDAPICGVKNVHCFFHFQ